MWLTRNNVDWQEIRRETGTYLLNKLVNEDKRQESSGLWQCIER